jgi:hypothetical protein
MAALGAAGPQAPAGAGAFAWKLDLGGDVVMAPVRAPNGVVVVSRVNGWRGFDHPHLVSLVTAEGTLLWSRRRTSRPGALPTVDGSGNVYVTDGNGRVDAIDSGGAIRWSYVVAGAGASDDDRPPASVAVGPDGTAFVAGRCLYALDGRGQRRWHACLGERLREPLLVPGGVVARSARTLYRVGFDGAVTWKTGADGADITAVAVGANAVVYATATALTSLEPGSARVHWQVTVPGPVEQVTILDNGGLAVFQQALLSVLDRTGREIWRSTGESSDRVWGPATRLADGSLVVGGGALRVLARDGRVIGQWRAAFDRYVLPPVVIDDRLAVTADFADGALKAIRLPLPTPVPPQPQIR